VRGRGCGEKKAVAQEGCVVRRRAAALDDPGTLIGGEGGMAGYVTIGDLVAAMEEARSAIAALG
jgi:hypothetical protein